MCKVRPFLTRAAVLQHRCVNIWSKDAAWWGWENEDAIIQPPPLLLLSAPSRKLVDLTFPFTHTHTPLLPPSWRLPVRPLWHTALLKLGSSSSTAQHPCPPSSLPDWKYRRALNRRAACQIRANCLVAVGDVWPCVMRTVFSAPENQTLQPCQRQRRCIEKVSLKFSTAGICRLVNRAARLWCLFILITINL